MRRLIISAINATSGRRWIGPHPSRARRLEEKFSVGGSRRRLDVPLKSKPRANHERSTRIDGNLVLNSLDEQDLGSVAWGRAGPKVPAGRDRTRKEALDRGGSNLQSSVFYNGSTTSAYSESLLKLRVMTPDTASPVATVDPILRAPRGRAAGQGGDP